MNEKTIRLAAEFCPSLSARRACKNLKRLATVRLLRDISRVITCMVLVKWIRAMCEKHLDNRHRVSPRCASALQMHRRRTLIVDEPAGGWLQMKEYYRWVFANEPE